MPPDQRPRILIVEDDTHIQILLRYLLTPAYQLQVVNTVDAALEAAGRTAFDLFVIDINLGEDRSGIDLLHALRAQPAYQHAPAVACTAYALCGDRERFLALGFTNHLGKPFTRQALLTTVAGALAERVRAA